MFSTCIFILILLPQSFAQHQQKTHVHGISNLTIAFENSVLQIELNAPLIDIVGFENKTKTEIQKQSLKLAIEVLKNSKEIFSFNGGSCKEKKVLVTTGYKNKKHEHKHQNHNENKNDIHKDLKILYSFNCTNPANLIVINIHLFDKFPKIVKINTQWVTVNGQGQKVLDQKRNQVTVR